MGVLMHHYNPRWPSYFEKIASQLDTDLRTAEVKFTSIIHIGSTSIPDLNAKPIIDILITIPAADFENPDTLSLMISALREGNEQGGYYYIGDGGIRDRWSFKLGIREDMYGSPVMPRRSVYVVPDGGVLHRTSVAFRDCLRKEENSDLREEYGHLKWELAIQNDFVTIHNYSDQKTDIIRKVLMRAGCTPEEIKAKEDLREVHWPDELIV